MKDLIKNLKPGAPVAYQDNCGEIREGNFLCTSKPYESMSAPDILPEILSTEEEIRSFCEANKLCDSQCHLFK